MIALNHWVCLVLLGATAAVAGEFSFPTPSDDRWQYPFNATPGFRPLGSCFGAVGNDDFNDRDGVVVVAWDTSAQIPPGQGEQAYRIQSVTVTFTNRDGAEWPVDLTPDEWFTYDLNGDEVINADGIPRGEPGDTDGESDDVDPGRPIELFGAGFGPDLTESGWTETSPYFGGSDGFNAPRDPFPLGYRVNPDDSIDVLHLEDHVRGLHNDGLDPPLFSFTAQPWAIGTPDANHVPSASAPPFEVTCEIDLALSGGEVERYFQRQLNTGRVILVVTSLREAAEMGPQSGYPVFYLKEAVGNPVFPDAAAPELRVVLCEVVSADFDHDCDVDADDHALFEACATGPGIGPPTTGCENRDLDGDNDIDQSDFSLFQRCLSGPGVPADPDCLTSGG